MSCHIGSRLICEVTHPPTDPEFVFITHHLQVDRPPMFKGKGLGLQAVSSRPGAIVYEKGALLGFLTDVIALPGSCCEEWVVALDGYQIVCNEKGNCFRLLNHACTDHAVARLRRRAGIRADYDGR